MITQIDRQGNVTIFCNGNERMSDHQVSQSHIDYLNRLRNISGMNERDKFNARMKMFRSTTTIEND